MLCLIDDIAIFSFSFEEHLKHIEDVLARLKFAGLTTREDKSSFGEIKCNILGNAVSTEKMTWIRTKSPPFETYLNPQV